MTKRSQTLIIGHLVVTKTGPKQEVMAIKDTNPALYSTYILSFSDITKKGTDTNDRHSKKGTGTFTFDFN